MRFIKKIFGSNTPSNSKKNIKKTDSDITLQNTATNRLEKFVPISEDSVKIYSCGPTVYDRAHIGNLRSFVTADILKRILVQAGYTVEHTINFTDFGHLSENGSGEDKMTKGLMREGLPITMEAMRELSSHYIKIFKDDFSELHIIPPTTWARASDYVKEQIKLIKSLEEKGFTYEINDGLYFSVEKFSDYGRLENIDINNIKAGARVEINQEKHHPADFAVWKKGDLGWDSDWGKGFPGWHIECSAMALKTLGEEIDIHTGGEDLASVHHNAEIAQSETATGKTFVHYWIHNAFITIDNTKVSKSLGNTITMNNLLEKGFSGDDYRYWLLTAHYRSPINFSWEALLSAKQSLVKLKRYMYEEYKQEASLPSHDYLNKFNFCLKNDMDTPGALAILWEMIKDDSLTKKTKCGTLLAMDDIFDIGLSQDLNEGLKNLGMVSLEDVPDEISELIKQREIARAVKNWTEADHLRDLIREAGYEIDDTQQGTKIINTNN